MRTYIAGPMRKRKAWNFPAFDKARDLLISLGHDPVSPADLDRALGVTPRPGKLPADFIKQALRRDFIELCKCDAIAFLPGWQNSHGACAERKVARYIGLRLFQLDPDAGTFEEEPC